MSAKRRSQERATVLVADDESGIRDVFREMITEMGYRVVTASDSEQATALVKSEPVRMAFIDNWMPPGINGIEAINRWKEDGLLSFPAVVVTGFAKIESAAEAMRNGAFDVLSKPIKREQVEALLNKVQIQAQAEIFDTTVRDMDMGKSPTLMRIKGELLRAAAGNNPVSMVGGPNDGCEFFAMLLHPMGKPWVLLNDQRSMESNPMVRLSEARHGTVYIKHVDRMSLVQQRGLELMVRNAGTCESRVACEMRLPVEELAERGMLEKGLAEFLAPVQVNVPPLSEYKGDLAQMLDLVSRRLCMAEGFGEARFSEEASGLMLSDSSRWTKIGLDGLVAVARILLRGANGGTVEAEDVANLLHVGVSSGHSVIDESIFTVPLRESRNQFEKMYFERLLERTNHNYVDAAQFAGIERTYLYRKVKTVLGTELAKEA